jgi:hypothetical protein
MNPWDEKFTIRIPRTQTARGVKMGEVVFVGSIFRENVDERKTVRLRLKRQILRREVKEFLQSDEKLMCF